MERVRGLAARAGVVPAKSGSVRRNVLWLEEMLKVNIVIFSRFGLGLSRCNIDIFNQGDGANSDNGSELSTSHFS